MNQQVAESLGYEFLRPLVNGWMGKTRAALESPQRRRWQEVRDECLMFYSKSAAAMWNADYQRKFWSGVQAPRFQFTVNKAFELVAIYGPNLMWDVPHRTVTPKKQLQIPQELLEADPQMAQMLQQAMQMQQVMAAKENITAQMLESALNYFAKEQPYGGLSNHSKKCVVDALLTGRGVTASRPYKYSGSNRQLVGSFRVDPQDVLIDPDATCLSEAKWIAIKHVDPHWEVERRFGHPPDSLRNRASLESSWTASEVRTQVDGGSMDRQRGITNDLVVWWEIYSKTGPGCRMSGMQSPIREHLEQVVGDYAYIAVSAAVPFPLNCSAEKIRSGASDAQVKKDFEWPVPLWADNRWPVEFLDFYEDPESPYPIAPLAPGLGELKFMNHMLSWLANRIYSSSRDFWAVAGPHVDHYRDYLQNTLDQGIIPTPMTVDDVRKAITVLTQPETRFDTWRIFEKVSEFFDKRVGLTEFAYGRNEDGTQDRTAETTIARSRAVGARPEQMQKVVVEWQSNLASLEAFLARWFVKGEDLEPLLGPAGRMLWEQHVMSTDVEMVVRQMSYDVAAASIRRPNAERAMANFQALLNTFAGVIQTHAQQTGNYSAINAMLTKWGEINDESLEGIVLEDPQPDPEAQQMQQQQMELEMQRIQAELQKAQMDLQKSQMDLQARVQQMQMQAAGQQQQLAMDQQRFGQDTEQNQIRHLLEIVQDQEKHVQEMRQLADKHRMAMAQQKAKAQQAKQQAKQQANKPAPNPRRAAA